MSVTEPQPRVGAVCDVEALVAYFSENELAVFDGTFLYRSLLPRHVLRVEVDRLHDGRLRELAGSGVVTHDRGLFEIGCLRIHREGRDLRVACRLSPDEEETTLFSLRNVRSRLSYVPARPPAARRPRPSDMIVRSSRGR